MKTHALTTAAELRREFSFQDQWQITVEGAGHTSAILASSGLLVLVQALLAELPFEASAEDGTVLARFDGQNLTASPALLAALTDFDLRLRAMVDSVRRTTLEDYFASSSTTPSTAPGTAATG